MHVLQCQKNIGGKTKLVEGQIQHSNFLCFVVVVVEYSKHIFFARILQNHTCLRDRVFKSDISWKKM